MGFKIDIYWGNLGSFERGQGFNESASGMWYTFGGFGFLVGLLPITPTKNIYKYKVIAPLLFVRLLQHPRQVISFWGTTILQTSRSNC